MRAAAFLCVAFFAGAALAAPTKNECVDANATGQAHRLTGKLLAARDDFTSCLSASCPEIVRDNCRMRLAEVKSALPSVVFSVPPTSGAFLSLDGASVPLDGSAVDVDPGEHEVTLNAPGNAPIRRTITLREGEKLHREAFPALVVTRREVAPSPTHASSTSPLRIAGIVTGAVGLVGIGFGAAFGVAGFGAWGAVQSECLQAATCDLARAQADRNRALGFATASDVAFIAGGVLLAAGVTMFVLGHATVTVSRDTVAFALRGSF
jgi:hypothetical protein